jgi:phosphoribosylanthranilate isomerase
MTVSVKICGLTTEDAVRAVISAKADYAGFVYFPASPRHLSLRAAVKLKSLLTPQIKSISVLVDPDDNLLTQVHDILKPDFLQLHGRETPERVQAIKTKFPYKIIKSILVETADDIAGAMRYSRVADMLLFDARPQEFPGMLPGGNGLSFEWNLLKDRQFPLPWMLSGGLNADNIREAIHSSGAQAVDVSSSVESAPGIKNPALIKSFVEAARTA